MTISKKLYLNFGLLLALVLVLCVINILAVQREHLTRAATARAAELASASENVRVVMMMNRLALNNYLMSGDPRQLAVADEGERRLSDSIKRATDLALNDQQRLSFERLRDSEQRWHEDFLHPMVAKRKQVDGGNSTVAEMQIAYLQLNPNSWMSNSNTYLNEVEAATARLLEERHREDERAATGTIAAALVGTVLAIVLGIAISFRTSRSITDPLDHLITVAREIGEGGDLEHEIDSTRKDEIGELARTFNAMVRYLKEMAGVSQAIAGGDLTVEVRPRSPRDTLGNAFQSMVEGLRSLVSSVRSSAAQVASGSSQVAGASDDSAKISVHAASAIDEVTSTMHEMTINVQNMVKNTQVQASSVSETSASIDQMVASIQRVADTAKVLIDISQRSREEVQSGITTMEKATDGLNRINKSIASSGAIIDALGQRADDIGKIIEVIDDLAEQTNLLALNAAIEAARAGEHGLGFAVVADEVRKLAEKSAHSTKEIAELIQSIQREARKAVENMNKSTGIVDEGLAHGTELHNALRKIASVVTEVYKFAQEIGAATNEQSHGSSQIARATIRLNEITHEINSAVEEQASGAQGVVRAMEKMRELVQRSTSGSTELAASAEQMSRMSSALLEAMDNFTLENASRGNGNGRTNGARRAQPARAEERVAEAKYAALARS